MTSSVHPGSAARPVRVLYDISVLGYGQLDLRSRTGVYRVIEEVAKVLSRSNHSDVAFCAAQGWLALTGAVRYLEKHRDRFPVVPLVTAAPIDPIRAELSMTLRRLIERLPPELETPSPYTGTAALFQKLHIGVKQVLQAYAVTEGSLEAANLQGFDIFHSTFHPIPSEVRAHGSATAMFTTVYDLIPLMLPDMYAGDGSGNGEFKQIVSTLQAFTPEDHVLCISESTRNDLLDFAPLDPDRVRVTPLAANPETFRPCVDAQQLAAVRSRYGIPEGPYLLGVSTLEPRKNLDHLIRCFARLVRDERLTDLQLVLVGAKGWEYGPIFEELRKAALPEGRIMVTGFVADADLSPLYSGALAFVYPSLYEGFGLPPLEAMQCGTPAITSNTSSLPEVVGEAGIMVDPRDADTLCQAMLRLYRDGDLRAELARRSLERANLFTWERTAELTISAYRSALA